ncbi:hypothetical protein [Clostridium sulfidigenes]|uniref:hypothetical protein n=1 Tax=Clostridium sulfidigenes TaxID=318464 RepID=UPI003F8AEB38
MFVELDNENRFVQYHQDKDMVAPEHKDFTIEVTEELYKLLQGKKPWQLTTIENKIYIYDVQDGEKFVEIIVVQPKTELEILKETVEELVLANLLGV